MAKNIIDLTDDSFESEVKNENSMPVLVDFWASWCMPCKMIAPSIEQLAVELAGKLKVCKMSLEENQRTASDLGIMSIPTLVLFKGGKEITRLVGAMGKDEIKKRIENHLG